MSVRLRRSSHMKVVRVTLWVVVAGLLVCTRPVVSARGQGAPTESKSLYTVRLEKGETHPVRFRLLEPRGDSIVEADQIDFVLSPKGLTIRPSPPTFASGTAGTLTFESF